MEATTQFYSNLYETKETKDKEKEIHTTYEEVTKILVRDNFFSEINES